MNIFAQIQFENGYYIDNNDQKIDCQIRNIDWRNNPTFFNYRLSENDDAIKMTLESVKEFSINNTSKYVRSIINIDRSSDNINNLSRDKNPIFKEEKLFLKVLIEGKSTLYEYIDGNIRRYFYKNGNSNIEQLVYKRYKSNEKEIGENIRFRQQLFSALKCEKFKKNRILNIAYNKSALVKFFSDYSACHDKALVNYDHQVKQKRDLFNLTLRPRVNSSSLSISNASQGTIIKNVDFGNETGFGFGLETEFIFPFNKNKWSILIEPTYQSFKSKKSIKVSNILEGQLIAEVSYNSIEVPVSLRYYFFLNKNSSIFINGSFLFDISSKTSINFKRTDGSDFNSLDITTRNNLAIGTGFKIKDRFSLELRYQMAREILSNYVYWNTDYKTLSLIFGYSLF